MNVAKKSLDTMLQGDHFTEWLGLQIDEHGEGYCRLHFTVRKEMLNGFGIVHGGAVFAAADSAFAFACNAHGRVTVALDVTISFVQASYEGDVLIVQAREVHAGNRTGFYDVRVTKQDETLVALFRGTAYKTSKPLFGQGDE